MPDEKTYTLKELCERLNDASLYVEDLKYGNDPAHVREATNEEALPYRDKEDR